jgi:ribose/xylose/arabinose/galactoside ABC-type transport system permease subunit
VTANGWFDRFPWFDRFDPRRFLVGSTGGLLPRGRVVDLAFMALFALLVLGAALSTDVFFSQSNLLNLSRQIVANGLISLGMLFVILSGGIDLSVGAVVAMAGIVTAGTQAHVPLTVAILIGLMVGALAGAVNGVLIARFNLAPFIVTLATLSSFRGLVYVYSDTPVTPENPAFRSTLGAGSIGIAPVSVVILILCFIAGWLFLNRTVPGRGITALGGNMEAVRLAGFNVRRYTALPYVISGVTSALAGILIVSRLGIAQPSLGVAYELDAIAATVIGGAVLGGGGGSVGGTLGGVLVLGVINNLLNLLNVQSYFQQVIKGAIILIAVLARRREKGR